MEYDNKVQISCIIFIFLLPLPEHLEERMALPRGLHEGGLVGQTRHISVLDHRL